MQRKGFTLIELLIVIAIIAILAAVVFVALDPLTRFQDARDASRWQDTTALLSAIKINQIDNGGYYLMAISNLVNDTVYMIGTAVSACNTAYNAGNCDVAIINTTDCVDLTGLASQGYLGSVPVSPTGNATWDETITGYTLKKASTGIITIQACESENTGAISVSR